MAAAEQKKSYQVIKQFKGLNTKANRTAIDESEFSWIENAQPIGYGNIKILPTSSAVTNAANVAVTFSNDVIYLTSCNINVSDYVVAFLTDGSAEYYDIENKKKGTVAAAGTFSASAITTQYPINTTQWYNDRMLILDPVKGYFSWDGNNVVSIGSVGVIGITNKGSGYTSAPTVTISGPDQTGGIQANATATVTTANTVSTVVLSNAGTGYTNGANLKVTFTGGGGSNAAAVAGITTFATGTVSVAVINGGAGYTNAANTTISFSGGGGSGAAGTAIISGNVVTNVIMTNPGSGYTNSANLIVTISGGGATNNAILQGIVSSNQNVGIASFSGRVWIAQGRTIYYSAAGSYSDFTSVSAGSVTLTDSTLHGNIQQLLSANNFLYIFGDDSINVFSDVRVTTNGSTLFTNTNVSASVGSKLAYAIFPYFRSVLFMNNYGIYALVGSTTSKLSDSLDGMFPNIDFVTEEVTGGQVLLNNILCAAFNFRYYDAQFTQSYRYIQAVFFEKKWFLTSQGDNLQYTTSVPVGGIITMYGTRGRDLYRLYNDSTSPITSRIQTALLPLTDPIRTKQALKFGIEATLSNGGELNVTVDSEQGSSPAYTLGNFVTWYNSSNTTIPWINNSSTVISWLGSTGYYLYKSDAQQWGKYLGLTQTSNSAGFVVNTFEFEHELRVRF
jgi:hypothetical protein